MSEELLVERPTHWVDQAIVNARSGVCMCGRGGKIIYGPSPFGYGPTCKRCRKRWSKREGKPWRSNAQIEADRKREREDMAREVESMPPMEFYAAWADTLAARLEQQGPRWRWYDLQRDEFGVTAFGSATPLGQRYYLMRDRVRRDREAHEALARLSEGGEPDAG